MDDYLLTLAQEPRNADWSGPLGVVAGLLIGAGVMTCGAVASGLLPAAVVVEMVRGML